MVRTRLVLAWLVAALLAAAALAMLRARLADEPARPIPLARPGSPLRTGDPTPAAPSLDATAARAIVRELDAARAAAYADPLAGDPDGWDAPSCACHAEDVRRLRDLARSGLSLRGAVATLVEVAVARAGPDRVELVVVDRLSSYVTADRAGRTVRRWPARGPTRWRLVLVRVTGRWLLGALARAP